MRNKQQLGARLAHQTVVADPPWLYRDSASAGKRGAVHKYACMSPADIIELADINPMHHIGHIVSIAGHLVAPDAHLYLWTTNAFMGDALGVMRLWGFDFKTIITWVKPGIGMGSYFRNNTEHCLFGVRGRLPILNHSTPTAFHHPRLAHSQKPDAFLDMVERCSPGPYLELFARRARPGWTQTGDEL